MEKEIIAYTADLGTEVAFSSAVKVRKARLDSLIFVSGQVATDEGGNVVGRGDMKAQTRQALENVKAALAKLGATLDDVVKVTIFVTDMSDFKGIHEVRRQYFKRGNYPASTLVQVSRLVQEDLLIEIEAIAVV
jgi:2-iminobutanoate/2-iminopropanoate deaminase